MGYSDDALERPIVGITNTYSEFNPCHATVPQLIAAVKRGRDAGRRAADGVPDDLDPRVVRVPDQHVPAQPDGARHRGDDPRAAGRRGRADRRLRQDDPGAADGRSASANVPAIVVPTGPMLTRTHQRRAARRVHRLPALLGALPRGRDRSAARSTRVNARLAPTAGTCMVMGTASTIACIDRSDGDEPARRRDDSRGARRAPAARPRPSGRRGRCALADTAPEARRDSVREGVHECADRAARDRRIDQCADPS